MDFPGGASGKETVCQCRICNRGWIRSVGRKDPLEAIHSSIPAWEDPWTEEPGGLQSTRSKRVILAMGITSIIKKKHTNTVSYPELGINKQRKYFFGSKICDLLFLRVTHIKIILLCIV